VGREQAEITQWCLFTGLVSVGGFTEQNGYMDMLRKYQREENCDGSAAEHQADVLDVLGVEAAPLDSRDETVSGRSNRAAPSEATIAKFPRPQAAASGSRDLLDTYFRNMGTGELLSREQELALAKRIDEAQQALLGGLCRIPMFVARVGTWARELDEERIRLDYLVEASTFHDEQDASQDPLPDIAPRIQNVATLADDVARLAQRRIAALSRGKELSRRDRAQLDDLLSRAAVEIIGLHLQSDRVPELMAVFQAETRRLRQTEQELEQLAERCGVARQDLAERHYGRELDPHWIGEMASLPDVAWHALTQDHVGRLAELGAEFAAIAQRTGLPISELHRAIAEVSQEWRELKRLREDMVRAHLRLVIAIAKKYRTYSSLDLLDLIQEGNLGLMRAVERYNHRRGVKVATYSVWWIRQAITRAMADQGQTIRVPVHMANTAKKVQREKRKLYRQLGREPAADEIAARSGIPIGHVERALVLVQQPASLDVPVGDDGDVTLAHLIEAPDSVDPHVAAEAAGLEKCVAEALADLTPREERIMRMRFGIGCASAHTLEEIGKTIGVTSERIRQIEAKVLRKLRESPRADTLLTFTES